MPTTAVILNNAPIACVLAGNAVAKGNLFGGTTSPDLPKTIFACHYVLKKIYDEDPDYPGLRWAALRLWELCGKYAIQAYAYTGGGGSVAPITPPSLPDYYDFVVSSSSPIVTGAFLLLIDGTLGNYDFRGYNIAFYRGNNLQSKFNDGATTCYSWNKVSGLLTLINGVAQVDEPIQIYPML